MGKAARPGGSRGGSRLLFFCLLTSVRTLYYKGGPMHPADNGQPADKGKSPRLRNVYPAGEIPHLWANGILRDVRSRSSSVEKTPDGIRLVSYSTTVAFRTECFTPQGVRVYLFTSRTYSTTTSRLVSKALAAIPNFATFKREAHWDGRRETIAEALYCINEAPVDLGSISFAVPNVGSTIGGPGRQAHRENLAHILGRAIDEAAKSGRKSVRFAPVMAGELFSQALLYWRTFLADEPDPLAGVDFGKIAESFAKAARRQAAAEQAGRDARRKFERDEDLWMAEASDALAAVAAVVRSIVGGSQADAALAAVLRYETTGADAPPAEDSDALDRLAAALQSLARYGSNLDPYAANRNGAGFVDGVKAVCPSFAFSGYLPPYPKAPVRYVFGKPVSDFMPRLFRLRDAVGLPYGRGNRTARFGRQLIRVDGEDLRTSDGAAVPLTLIRALWSRHGAEVKAAAAEPVALTLPASRTAGHYTWTGYQIADAAARASGSGASLLRIGCHLVGAEDLVRLAARLGWPDPA